MILNGFWENSGVSMVKDVLLGMMVPSLYDSMLRSCMWINAYFSVV